MRVFDFFAGCGGTSVGFRDAGMHVTMALDIDQGADASYRLNNPDVAFIREDIRALPTEALAPFMPATASTPVLFSGCAPCQPFSRQNRSHYDTDPRRSLLGEFGRFVARWHPDYVFVENVPGMQRVPDDSGPLAAFKALLTELNYHHVSDVVPALGYGVPQLRERLILLASKKPGLRLPAVSHGGGKLPASTVREWIGDLPPLRAGEVHASDPDHQAAHLSDSNIARIAATPEGGGRESWPRELWLECHKGHAGHSDVYGRLAWDRPAAGLTTRCVSYSNGRFGHPTQNRAISVREAACLQTFPRTYRFYGSLASRARQIGNAVPPLMARAVGNTIRTHCLG
jgi:DNA (cytosine-5)-methyltransferase 1